MEVVTRYRTHDKYIPIFENTLQSGFTNQPTGDQFEVVSANAGDTQKITVWFTETGSTTLKSETLTLTGATAVPSVSTTVATVYGAFLGTDEGTISKRAAGTITIRKKTGALAISTITVNKMSTGTQIFRIGGRNIEFENIAGNTWISSLAPSNLTTTGLAVSTGAALQIAGRASKLLTVSGYLSVASDVTGSTSQITILT
jgi:hypothetical protein